MVTKTINGNTTVLAVFGDPIRHSLSPLMHNSAFAALNWNCVYIPCHVKTEHLSDAVRAIKSFHWKGVNITIPHKQTVLKYLDEIVGDSKISGSVNTIINQEGRLIGMSTDGSGFIRSIRDEGQFEIKNKKIVLLGAGGSARAIIYRLIAEGIHSLAIVNRDLTKATGLQERIWNDTGFTVTVYDLSHIHELDWDSYDLLINTTPVGLYDEISLVPPRLLRPHLFVYDLLYKKGGTQLYRDAKANGCRVLSGLSLLLYQGAESFKLWFDSDPPLSIMRQTIYQDYEMKND